MIYKKIYVYAFVISLAAPFCTSCVSYRNLDPVVAQFLDGLSRQDGPPIYTLPVKQARKVLDDLQASTVNIIPATLQEIMIPGGPTKEVSITIVRPKNSKGILPAIVFLHGGGWILGNKNTHDYLARKIAYGANAAVIIVNYPLSPEAHYPIAIEQAYAVADYIEKNGQKLQLDGNRMAIVGDSVGGLMATVVAQMAKDRNGPQFRYQVLFYPVTDANFNTGSYKQFADGFWLTKKAMEWFWDAYMPDKSQRKKSYVSPLHATIEQLKGLPPTLIIVDENDVLRDEGEAYARKLMQAGVDVTAVRFLGIIHDFVMLAPLKDTAATRGAIDLATCTLKKAFGK